MPRVSTLPEEKRKRCRVLLAAGDPTVGAAVREALAGLAVDVVDADPEAGPVPARERFERLARLGHWEWVPSGTALCSATLLEILGLSTADRRLGYGRFLRLVHPDDRAAVVGAIRSARRAATGFRLDHRVLDADGGQRTIFHRAEPVVDAAGRAIGAVGIVQDVTDRDRRESEMRRLAHYDPLTGLPNRTLLLDLLGRAIAGARRQGCLVAVLFIDLDGFKPVNDRLGHQAGDALLCAAAKRFLNCLRSRDARAGTATDADRGQPLGDTVARLGGDEFVAVLTDVREPGTGTAVARRLNEALAAPFTIEGSAVRVTASIGVGLYPADGADAETLIKAADRAMYRAKARGRNRFAVAGADPGCGARTQAVAASAGPYLQAPLQDRRPSVRGVAGPADPDGQAGDGRAPPELSHWEIALVLAS